MLVDFLTVGYSEALFWDSTPRQINAHFTAARKRMAIEHNGRLTQAWWSGVIAKAAKTPPIKDLLIDDDLAPRAKQSWQHIKAALMLALPPEPKD